MSSREPYRVELLNTPDYKQGESDSLCTYYTGAMMLATLYPAYVAAFGSSGTTEKTTKNVSNDPIITTYSNQDHRHILARWFYFGEWIENMVRILNAIMKADHPETRFEFRKGNPSSDQTLYRIVESINERLPVMLGWDAEDYGCHAVLVTGYMMGKEEWLITNDPSGGSREISWNSLKSQQDRRFEVGLRIRHVGPRPMKRTTAKHGESPAIYQWTKAEKYESFA